MARTNKTTIGKLKAPRKRRIQKVVVQRGTFSPEQKAELKKLLPAYRLCKRTPGKKWEGFWEPTWQLLFGLFPLKPLTEEQITEGVDQGDRKGECMALYQQRTREYFNNSTRDSASGKACVILSLSVQKKAKLLPATQAYMSLFKDMLRPLITQEWTDFVMSNRTTEKEKANPIPPVSIAFRNQFAKRSLSEMSPEVHQEVEEY
ncbi:hypothetical protein FIBSPDRAFT_948648 [Athelia psychrophila]|uniref:Uncharacterized protein n=1 Tax=Athelia psychrophila TaxID=1759441 RepID=A0A166QP25_9AGAM|nr:hypothetical protein FIBSPDRAFT_948648 [Fibularhizoctonia sp. CBS 109695]